MTDDERIRDAIADIDGALKDHREFGPYYDPKEIDEMCALRDKLRARLSLQREDGSA